MVAVGMAIIVASAVCVVMGRPEVEITSDGPPPIVEEDPDGLPTIGEEDLPEWQEDYVPEELDGDIVAIKSVPRTDDDLTKSYDRARSGQCELVRSGEPLEIKGFTPFLTPRDRASKEPIPSSRVHALSIGLEVGRQDRNDLPRLSRSAILEYVDDHYVSIQIRVQRDPVTNAQFLHHRPLAATSKYGRVRLTQDTTPAVLSSVRELRSLGVLMDEDAESTPENRRTLVLAHRHSLQTGFDEEDEEINYELTFVRAVPENDEEDSPIELHTFVTTDHRTKLHYAKPGSYPSNADRASVKATVRFTEYSHAGLYPTKSSVRSTSVYDRGEFDFEKLDRYAESQEWEGDALDNIVPILDAIIAGDLKS